MSRRKEIEELLQDGNPEFERILEKDFKNTDFNKDGYIDTAEFGKVAEDFDKLLGGSGEIRELLNSKFVKYDINKDKRLSKDEFRGILREIILSVFDDLFPK